VRAREARPRRRAKAAHARAAARRASPAHASGTPRPSGSRRAPSKPPGSSPARSARHQRRDWLRKSYRGGARARVRGPRARAAGRRARTGRATLPTEGSSPANAKVTTFGNLDGVGRPGQITLPGGAQIALGYDADGRITSVTPPGKGTHTFAYNALGRLAVYDPPVSPAVQHFYNKDRQLTRIEQPATPEAELIAELLYNGTTGQLVTINTPAADIGLSYSPTTGQLTQLTSPEGSGDIVLEQSFDGFLLNALRWSEQGRGSVAWQHNDRFLIATETVRGGTLAATPVSTTACPGTVGCVAYSYDADGITTSISSGQGASAVTYSLTPNAATGRIETKTIGLIRETLAYNAHGELARQTVVNTQTNAVLFEVVYDDGGANGARDALGRITKKTETVDGVTRVFEYGYNPAGRPWLETVRVDGDLVSEYAYDDNGNRTSVELDRSYAGGGTVSLSGAEIVTDSEDRLTRYGDLELVYDDLGRVIEKRDTSLSPAAVTKYAWDSLGALRRVDLPDGRVIEYMIDAIGRRVGKKVNGVVQRRWVYRDTLRPIAELDATGNVVARYVYADGVGAEDEATRILLTRLGALSSPDAVGAMSTLEGFLTGAVQPEYIVRTDGVFRLAADHLGTIKVVADVANGNVMLRREYDEFGVVLTEIGSLAATDAVPFGFAGGMVDRDTELVRFGAREYSSRLGRWMAKDPIGFASSEMNLYAIPGVDPLRFRDYSGLQDLCGSENAAVPPWLVPDDAVVAGLKGACRRHDDCYATCGASKAVCDFGLFSDILGSCRLGFGAAVPILLLPIAGNCGVVASAYYAGVHLGGGAAFAAAQAACPEVVCR